jgi:hypothetical protein
MIKCAVLKMSDSESRLKCEANTDLRGKQSNETLGWSSRSRGTKRIADWRPLGQLDV